MIRATTTLTCTDLLKVSYCSRLFYPCKGAGINNDPFALYMNENALSIARAK